MRWVIGSAVPIRVWMEAPAGRRSNALLGAFETK
jgi:hypothetical protein